MCGRYNVTKKLLTIQQELDLDQVEDEMFGGLINVAPGSKSLIIRHPETKSMQWYQFGLTPYWSQKRMYMFNARAEGDSNKENKPEYRGAKGILKKPMFRKPIRSQRCLVVANSFIEGPVKEKLSKPFLIFRNDYATFTLGGIWDQWVDQETGEVLDSFAIITTAATSITEAVGHHRAPLLISPEARDAWLDPLTDLDLITSILVPFDGRDFNAYPISTDIKNARNQSLEVLQPTGPAIRKVSETKVVEGLELIGMGESPSRQRRAEEGR